MGDLGRRAFNVEEAFAGSLAAPVFGDGSGDGWCRYGEFYPVEFYPNGDGFGSGYGYSDGNGHGSAYCWQGVVM